MASLNCITLSGYLCGDPNITKYKTEKIKCTCQIAVQRNSFVEGYQSVDYINLEAWDNVAVFMGSYLKKGSAVSLLGELHIDRYEDEENNKKTFPVVKIQRVFASREWEEAKNEGSTPKKGNRSNFQTHNAPQYAKNNAPTFEELKSDDDLPF